MSLLPVMHKAIRTLSFLACLLTVFMVWGQSPSSTGQEQVRRVVQFSGLVLTADSLIPVPFTNIWIQNSRRGTISDFHGFFSITLREKDTLQISAVGFRDVTFIVPDTLTSPRYSTVQLMTYDTINLPETVIYPWPTREQFRYAFLNTDIPDDDMDRALKNLERAQMRERFEKMPMDGYANFNYMNQQHAQRLYYAGQRPPMRIFDPFAWSKFIKAWKEGRFRRDN
jgi:hypothetical protein